MKEPSSNPGNARPNGRRGAAAVALGLSMLASAPASMAIAGAVKAEEGPAPVRSAFFYEKPEVLNSETHRALRVHLPADATFAAQAHLVPIVTVEFPDVAFEYPIVFVKGGDAGWMALALTGLDAGRNLFVDGEGQWQAAYIPASVRRYPFVLAGREAGAQSVAVDMARASTDEDAAPLFDEGGRPTQVLEKAISFLKSYQGQTQATRAFISRLDELGLLTPAQFQLRNGEGKERRLDGFFIIREDRLRDLGDEQIVDLFRKGQFPLIQAQLLSLRNIAALQRREAAIQGK